MTSERFFSECPHADPDVAKRFIAKIRIVCKKPDLGECWEWTAYCNSGPKPYGRFRWEGKLWLSYRVSYLWAHGFLPDAGLQIDHRCDNHRCVRPSHLRPMTPKENALRSNSPMAKNARKKACPKGHPYNKQNTAWIRNGTARECRRCRNERTLAAYHKRKKIS